MIITKKYCLEKCKSRVAGLSPYIGQSGSTVPECGNWGHIPYSIDFSLLGGYNEPLFLKAQKLYVCTQKLNTVDEDYVKANSGKTYYNLNQRMKFEEHSDYVEENYSMISHIGIMRYRDMMDVFYRMEKIYDNTTYYKRITKKRKTTWVRYTPKKTERDDIEIYKYLPTDENSDDVDRYKYDYVGINTNDSDLEFLMQGTGLILNFTESSGTSGTTTVKKANIKSLNGDNNGWTVVPENDDDLLIGPLPDTLTSGLTKPDLNRSGNTISSGETSSGRTITSGHTSGNTFVPIDKGKFSASTSADTTISASTSGYTISAETSGETIASASTSGDTTSGGTSGNTDIIEEEDDFDGDNPYEDEYEQYVYPYYYDADGIDIWEEFGGSYNLYLKQYHKFILRYMGMKIVPDEYITSDNKVQSMISLAMIDNTIEELEILRNGGCCDIKEFNQRGGEEFLIYLKSIRLIKDSEADFFNTLVARDEDNNVLTEYIPVITFNILLVKNYDYSGLENLEIRLAPKVSSGSSETSGYTTISEETNSELTYLKDPQISLDDFGTELPFIVTVSSDTKNNIHYNIKSPYSSGCPKDTRIVAGDSETKYRNYHVGNIINSITINSAETEAEINYTIGAPLKRIDNDLWVKNETINRGITYTETVGISEEDFEVTYEDGILSGSVTSFNVSTANTATMSFKTKRMNDMEMERTLQDDVFFGIIEEPNTDVTFELDRGSATAFELHMKLNEINSLEDLENYHNNEFNI